MQHPVQICQSISEPGWAGRRSLLLAAGLCIVLFWVRVSTTHGSPDNGKQIGLNTNSPQHLSWCESLIRSQWASTVCSRGDDYHPMPQQEEPSTYECGANKPRAAGQDPENGSFLVFHMTAAFFFLTTVGLKLRGSSFHDYILHGWLIEPLHHCFFFCDCNCVLIIAWCLPLKHSQFEGVIHKIWPEGSSKTMWAKGWPE